MWEWGGELQQSLKSTEVKTKCYPDEVLHCLSTGANSHGDGITCTAHVESTPYEQQCPFTFRKNTSHLVQKPPATVPVYGRTPITNKHRFTDTTIDKG